MKFFIVTLFSVSILGCYSTTVKESEPKLTSDELVNQVGDEYYNEYYKRNRYSATRRLIPSIKHNKFFDASPEALKVWRAKEDRWYQALSTIDNNSISAENIPLLGVLLYRLETSIALRSCKDELMDIDYLAGWHNGVVSLLKFQPVTTDEDKQVAIERYSTLQLLVDTQVQNLEQGLAENLTKPKSIVKRVLKQLEAILPEKIESSPLMGITKRIDDGEFTKKWLALVKDTLYPALGSYYSFLNTKYLPAARESIGIADLPLSNSEKCYNAKIHKSITIKKSIGYIKQIGKK